jgi:hypothetical protein
MTTIKVMGREVELPEPEPAAAPEQAAWQADLAEGIGDPSDAGLAARVNAMSTQEFAQFRRGMGLAQSTQDFLAGN